MTEYMVQIEVRVYSTNHGGLVDLQNTVSGRLVGYTFQQGGIDKHPLLKEIAPTLSEDTGRLHHAQISSTIGNPARRAVILCLRA